MTDYAKPPFKPQTQPQPGLEVDMDPRPDYGRDTYQGTGKLKGKVALITGGDSGIGRAVALAYAREGAAVTISYLNEESDAQEAVTAIEAEGQQCLAISGDIREESHCQLLVKRTVEELGGLDILVNNAAFQTTHNSITEVPSEEFDRIYKTNVYAMFYLIKAAVPHLTAGSSIINTTSIQAYDPSPDLAPYASTKAVMVNLTKSLAKELGQRGIRVNAVAPGPVWTPLIPASMDEEKVAHFGQDSLMGRPAQPAELAPVYVFLASEEASYVTGHVYGVTGGRGWP